MKICADVPKQPEPVKTLWHDLPAGTVFYFDDQGREKNPALRISVGYVYLGSSYRHITKNVSIYNNTAVRVIYPDACLQLGESKTP